MRRDEILLFQSQLFNNFLILKFYILFVLFNNFSLLMFATGGREFLSKNGILFNIYLLAYIVINFFFH